MLTYKLVNDWIKCIHRDLYSEPLDRLNHHLIKKDAAIVNFLNKGENNYLFVKFEGFGVY